MAERVIPPRRNALGLIWPRGNRLLITRVSAVGDEMLLQRDGDVSGIRV